MKPKVTRLQPTKIALFWQRGRDKKHIGYYMPAENVIYTNKGRHSVEQRRNTDNRTIDQKNNAHMRRMTATYYTEDFTYRGK